MKIKCKKCGDIIIGQPNKFITCSCNSVYLDICYITEDGREIGRIGGNQEDIEIIGEKENELLL